MSTSRPVLQSDLAEYRALLGALGCALLLALGMLPARGEAMLELFNVSWSDLTQKMPEIAEAGYTALWLPNPAKGTAGSFSIGYDQFDPFDLGDKNQQGTVATHYGTRAQLLQMVQTAHRFGIRVYFDNVMNHRGSNVPGLGVATNFYPALIPQDFHLKTVSGGYQNWPNISNFCYQQEVQNQPLLGLCDLAQEPGSMNFNFGPVLGNTAPKPVFIRQPTNPEYYMDTNLPAIGGGWHGFNGTNGQPVPEDVTAYLIRAAMWTLYTTKCDGFRLDAVKHVPSNFFGNNTGGNTLTDDPSFSGYTGGIQAMYDWTHGYGSNSTANGYMETDGNRNTLFDTEAPRNDAMLFGEHISPVPDFQQYLNAGMRLCNQPLYNEMNNVLSGGDGFDNNGGMDNRDYAPSPDNCNGTSYPCYSAAQSVMFPQTQDGSSCCPTHQELQDAYYFMHEGLPMIYSDGFNHSGPPNYFPILSYAYYLGQSNDNKMPDVAYLHSQLARGGTRSRWHDHNIVAWERYDYRDVNNVGGGAFTNADATVVFFAENDNFNYPGDVMFDDGITRTPDGYYNCANGSPSRGYAMRVGFRPGSVLSQLASSSPSSDRACAKLLVHSATTDKNAALAATNAPSAPDRLLLVNAAPPPNGGAIELVIPSGGWVMYGYQWPEPSRANVLTNAITFRQAGAPVPTIRSYRHDGTNGDLGFNPLYPFKMRGSVDPNGNVIHQADEGNVSNLTYAIEVPVLTNAPFDMAVRSDASAANILARMDGGLDLNSQMGYSPTNGIDLRDNRPGYASDVYLGYEQMAQQFRYGPEKFAARLVSRNNVTSLGAETYYYTVGGTNVVINGSGNGNGLNTQTANWVYHDPNAPATVLGGGPATQMNPTNPAPSTPVDLWVKVGNYFQTNQCFIYFTTDGANPEGAYGVGKGTTHVVSAAWVNHDASDNTADWFKGTIPASNQVNGVQVRYKIALYETNIPTISDADSSKLYGLTQFGITNFDPTSVRVWLHNDLNTNNTAVGLSSGFHIVRAHCFLPRAGKSAVYNTYLQTFYYDGQLPGGVIAFPPTDGSTITSPTYTVDVMADSAVTEVDYTIADTNGLVSGVATPVTPDPNLLQQYPNYSQEYQFTYNPVASSGTATLNVTLKTPSTSVLTNRFTMLTRTVNARGPAQSVQIIAPPTDDALVVLASNGVCTIQACLTTNLGTTASLYSLYINGVLQPSGNYIIRGVGSVGGCPGMRSFTYNWSQPVSGTNLIQLFYTNGITLSDTRTFALARQGDPTDSDGDGVPNWMEILAGTNPYDASSFFHLTSLSPGDPVVISWSSVPGKTYQVLATTNLLYPMAALSNGVVSASTTTTITYWSDIAPDALNRFYRIQLVQ
jgi:hypothetical protein